MSNPKYMLDTDIASYAIRGQTPSVDRMLTSEGGNVCIWVITRAELVYGIQVMPTDHQIHLSTLRFIDETITLSWGNEAADTYADIRHELTTTGRPIGDRDVMIASHAISLGAVLVTNNTRHHGRLAPRLQIENWVDA